VLQREGRLGVERVCALLGPVADALDAVHEAGLVHRDVKPGNVLIARSRRSRGAEQVYLCDFGIAKGTAGAGGDITSAGQFFGTPHYSSRNRSRAGGWTGAPTSTGWRAWRSAASPARCPTPAPGRPR
jgi:serine/threonine protein kinase